MQHRDRYTTREVADRLDCRPSEALQLLRAASVPVIRCGSAFLWNGEAVDELVATLRERVKGAGAG